MKVQRKYKKWKISYVLGSNWMKVYVRIEVTIRPASRSLTL
jgi:hypothetical protein